MFFTGYTGGDIRGAVTHLYSLRFILSEVRGNANVNNVPAKKFLLIPLWTNNKRNGL